jgi:hypothetical protein
MLASAWRMNRAAGRQGAGQHGGGATLTDAHM